VAFNLIATHCQKSEGADPGLSEDGLLQAAFLRRYLAEHKLLEAYGIELIFCGVGKRHFDTAKALGFVPQEYRDIFGSAVSLEDDTIFLPCGHKIARSQYKSGSQYGAAEIKGSIRNAVIIAGRPVMFHLGFTEAKEGSIYLLDLETGQIDWIISAP